MVDIRSLPPITYMNILIGASNLYTNADKCRHGRNICPDGSKHMQEVPKYEGIQLAASREEGT